MASHTITHLVYYPAPGDPVGEPLRYIVDRAREIAADTRGMLLADPETAAWRAIEELAEASELYLGEAILPCLADEPHYLYPPGFLGLDPRRPPQWKGGPLRVTDPTEVSGSARWQTTTGSPTQLVHVDKRHFAIYPGPDAAGLTYTWDDVAATVTDGDASVPISGGQIDTQLSSGSEGLLVVHPDYPRLLRTTYGDQEENLHLWFCCKPSRTGWSLQTRVPSQFVRALEEFLVWQILRYSEAQDDLAKAEGAERRWQRELDSVRADSSAKAANPAGRLRMRAL